VVEVEVEQVVMDLKEKIIKQNPVKMAEVEVEVEEVNTKYIEDFQYHQTHPYKFR
jgi:hypothetical protein